MAQVMEVLFLREWWRYEPGSDWYATPYHWLNLLEGLAWLGFAVFVAHRYWRHRRSFGLEVSYAAAFVAFAITDFREAYVVHSWLIWLKAVIFAAILLLRWRVLRVCYAGTGPRF